MNSVPEFQRKNDSPHKVGAPAAVVVIAWAGVFYFCSFLFARISFSSEIMAMGASGLACTLSALGALVLLVGKPVARHRLVVILILCALADIGVNLAVLRFPPADQGVAHVYAGINVMLMGIAVCGGLLMSELIKKPSYIIPLAAAAGIADIWSVSFGVTNTIVSSRTAMNFLLFSFPVAGKGVLPIIGVTDFAFAAMFLSLSRKFDFPETKTRLLLAASFILSVGVAVLGGFGVPVLPVMGVLFIAGNYSHVKLTDPREKRDAAWGLLIIVAALVAVTLIKLAR